MSKRLAGKTAEHHERVLLAAMAEPGSIKAANRACPQDRTRRRRPLTRVISIRD
jgi:hypothetical protein